MRRLAGIAPLFLLTLFIPVLGAAPVIQSTNAQPRTPPVEDRLQLLERRMQALTDILIRLDSLQQEIQQLRGDVELQNHTLETLKKRQRDLYVDIDRRMAQLAGQPVPGGSGMAPAGVSPSLSAPAGTAAVPALPATPGGVASTVDPGVPTGMAVPPAPAAAPISAPPAPAGVPVKEISTTPPAGMAPVQPADPALEQPMYKQAFDLLMQRRYDEAKHSFRAFLAQYPRGRLAANAQYWVGEASYVTRDFPTALDEFSKVVQNYPASPKVSDALLKMGFIRYEQKEWVQARKTLEAVVEQYPTSTASRLAGKRLERMRIEGN